MTNRTDGKAKRADATRASLIKAAERLIAHKGLAQVSTREILQEAGQRNQSALQYHFGSKAGLMHATISERTAQIDVRREELVNTWEGEPTLREVLNALVLPLAELAETDEAGRNYVLFLSQAISQPDWDLRRAITEYTLVGLGKTFEHYDRCLSNLPDEERQFKQSIAYDAGVLALKRWCLAEAPKQSAQEISDLVIRATMAIIAS